MSTEAIESSPDLFYLPRESREAATALETGFLDRGGAPRAVRATEVRRRPEGSEEILFRTIAYPRPKGIGERLSRALIAARAISLTATLMPCLAVWAEGARRGSAVEFLPAISALVGAISLQLAVNLYNDVSDYRRLIDLPGTPGGSGVIEKGWFTPIEIRNWARFFAVFGVLAGLPALARRPVEIAITGGLGALGTLLYSHPRAGLKYLALGDFAVLALCGPVLTAGFSVAAFGTVIPSVLPIGGVLGLLACGLLHVNNLHDIEFDRARGAITLAGRIGFVASTRLLVAMYVGAAAALIGGVAAGRLPAIALAALGVTPLVVPLLRRVCGAMGPSSPELEGTRITAAKIHLLAGVLLSLSLFLSRWIGT